MFRDRLYFLSQLCHVDMKTMDTVGGIAAPDQCQEHLARQNFALVGHEYFEEIILGWRQLDLFPIQLHTPLREINVQGA